MKSISIKTVALLLGAMLGGTVEAAVVVLYQETFTGSAPGTYVGRDSVFGTVGYNGGVGNGTADVDAGATGGASPSGNGSFEGSFNAQGAPTPETDALRITDAGLLTDYATTYPGYVSYSWAFAFRADDVLPADLIISIGNGTDTFLYNILGQVTAGQWSTVVVPFSGWVGGPGSFPSSPMAGMTHIDITWSRNGTGAQQFYVDDFTLLGNTEAGSAVPEPNTLLMLSLAGAGLFGFRRRLRNQAVTQTQSRTLASS